MLTLESVNVFYGGIHALRNVSLTVNAGEVVTLIGANGAGKSTTLRAITGLLTPRSGRVVFEGEPHGDFYNPMGTVHGGWIATLIDTAMACAVHSSLKPGEIFTTVEMNITYVRPVQAATGTLRCEGVLLHSGGRVASAEGKVYDAAGNLVAHGSETCLITRAPRAQ